MSIINNPIKTSIQDFIVNYYSINNKNIIFWDTCALLEILRFPYRNGNLTTFKLLNKLNSLIQNNDIYSLASSLSVTEWNDNQNNVIDSIQDSLIKTSNYHEICISIINDIYTSSYISEALYNKNLLKNFETLADNILSKTLFIDTEEIANNALERVRDKLPPASKKQEFKDCTVWETILSLSKEIYQIDKTNRQIFYTVNTDDFVDKSKEPKIFHKVLLTEAAASNLCCCTTILEVDKFF